MNSGSSAHRAGVLIIRSPFPFRKPQLFELLGAKIPGQLLLFLLPTVFPLSPLKISANRWIRVVGHNLPSTVPSNLPRSPTLHSDIILPWPSFY
jgi:hypothetical protein